MEFLLESLGITALVGSEAVESINSQPTPCCTFQNIFIDEDVISKFVGPALL